MALNEHDRLKVLEIMKDLDQIEKWQRMLADMVAEKKAELMQAWRD